MQSEMDGSIIHGEEREHLPTFSPVVDRNLASYIGALRARIGGSVDWGAASGRYQSPTAVGAPLRVGGGYN